MGTYHIIGGAGGTYDNVFTGPSSLSPSVGTVPLYRAFALNATYGLTFSVSATRTFTARNTGIRSGELLKNLDTGVVASAGTASDSAVSSRGTIIPLFSRWATPSADTGPTMAPTLGGKHVGLIGAADASLSQSGNEIVLTLTAPFANALTYNYQSMNPGDLCIHDASNTVFYIRARTAGAITLVAQNNTNGSGNLLETITGGNFYFYCCRMFIPNYPTFATFATGSAALTDLGRDDDYAGYLTG